MKISAVIRILIKIYTISFVICGGSGLQPKSVSLYAQNMQKDSSWMNNHRNTQFMNYQSSSKSSSWTPLESRFGYNSFGKQRLRYQSPLRKSNSVPKSLYDYQKQDIYKNQHKNSEVFPPNTYWNNKLPQSRPQPLRGRPPISHSGPSTRNNIPQEVLQGLPSVVQGVYSRYSRGGTAITEPTTTSEPPVVWFPDLNHDCEAEEGGGGGGGGFNAFSFLAMVVSVGNVVSLLASNANNNINNNNDNNNINNDNIQDSNEGNNNNNLDTFTMIMFGGRRRRDLNNETFGINNAESSPSEDVANTVGLLFLRTWYSDLMSRSFLTLSNRNKSPLHDKENRYRQEFANETEPNTTKSHQSKELFDSEIQANTIKIQHFNEKLSRGNPLPVVTTNCITRSFCLANRDSAQLGKLGEDIAEVLSLAYTELVEGSIASAQELLQAGTHGRKGDNCKYIYPCAPSVWTHINMLQHGAIMEEFLAL